MSDFSIDTAFAKSLPLALGVRVVKVENGIIALDKPEGVRSHPNEAGRADKSALLTVPFDMDKECYVLADGRRIFLLHRIDAPTSGLLLLTADEKLATLIKELFAQHSVHKTYEALVFGNAGRGAGIRVWRDRLKTERGHGGARTSSGAGIAAVTNVRVTASFLAENGMTMSRLELEPETGRTHQLRVQCSARKLPMVGDATYGNFPWNKKAAKELGIKRLCLHAAAVKFDFPAGGRKLSFSAKSPAPEWVAAS